MRLTALDLSLSAAGVVDPDGFADTIRCPKGLVEGDRLAWWHVSFLVLFDQHRPTHIVIESPFVHHHNNTLKLGELYGIFRLAAGPTPITWVPPSTLKLAFTGKGNATKDDMRLAAIHRGLIETDSTHTDDAIDAIALWVTHQEGMTAA